jgi:hypothetical protein
MMSTCCSKHVQAWNKYIKKECVKLVINQNYVKTHGQQNIKYPLFWSDFNETWIFLGRISKNTQLPNFMKIRLQGAELFHTDRRTDRHDEANSRFSQFCERV